MRTSSHSDILTVLDKTCIWKHNPAGGYFSLQPSTGTADYVHVPISIEELHSVHPLAVSVLEAMFSHTAENTPNEPVGGFYYLCNIHVLMGLNVRVTDIHNEQLELLFIFGTQVNAIGSTIRIQATSIKTEMYTYQGENLPIVYYADMRLLDVNKSELDSRYPGWDERLRIAKDLELSKTESYMYAFCESKFKMSSLYTSESLMGVTFENI